MTDETNITPAPEAPPFTIWGFIARGFRGQEKLWQVFWIATIAVPQVAGIAVGLLLVLFTIVLAMLHVPKFIIVLLFLFVLFACFLYGGWSLVAVWRCAFNVQHRFWGYLARFYVLFVVLMLSGAVSLGWLSGWHSIESEQGEFACKQYDQEYETALKQGRGEEFANEHRQLGHKCQHQAREAEAPAATHETQITPAPQAQLNCPPQWAGFSLAGSSESAKQCDYAGELTAKDCVAQQGAVVIEGGTNWCRKNDMSGATLSLALKR